MQRELVSIIHVMLGNKWHEALVVISIVDEGHLDGGLPELLAAVRAGVEQLLFVA